MNTRLKALERRVAALSDSRQLVEAVFSDGSRRKMQLADTIPLLQENESGLYITDIIGPVPAGSGQLLELLQGLTGDVPESKII